MLFVNQSIINHLTSLWMYHVTITKFIIEGQSSEINKSKLLFLEKQLRRKGGSISWLRIGQSDKTGRVINLRTSGSATSNGVCPTQFLISMLAELSTSSSQASRWAQCAAAWRGVQPSLSWEKMFVFLFSDVFSLHFYPWK